MTAWCQLPSAVFATTADVVKVRSSPQPQNIRLFALGMTMKPKFWPAAQPVTPSVQP